MLSDTHPDAERVRLELLRKTTGAQRIAQMRSMTSFAIELSRRAIARANPELNQREVEMLWVEYTYGKELADKLHSHKRDNPQCKPTMP